MSDAEVEDTQLMGGGEDATDTQIDPDAPTQVPMDHDDNDQSMNKGASDDEGDVDADAPTQMMPPPSSPPPAPADVDYPESQDDVDPDAPTQVVAMEDDHEERETQVDPDAPTQIPAEMEERRDNEEEEIEERKSVAASDDEEEEGERRAEGGGEEAAEKEGERDRSKSPSVARSPRSRSNSPGARSRSRSGSRSASPGPRKRRQRIRSGSSSSRSRSRSPARSRKSASRSRSRSRSAARSRSGSRSRSVARSRSRSRSGSRSRSVARSRSRSGSRSRSRSIAKSRSRSKSGSRSRSRSVAGSRSRSRSRSRSGARSRSGSRSRSKSPAARGGGEGGDSSDEEIGRAKKRVVREAFGDDSDNSDAEEGGSKKSDGDKKAKPKKRIKRTRINSEGEEEEEEVEVTDDEAVREGVSGGQVANKPHQLGDSSSDDEGPSNLGPDQPSAADTNVCDFDMMLERKKAEQRRRRRKKDIDLINDNDDAIAKMIADMKLAAREDRDLNSKRLPATKKISMLPIVMSQLNKADLQMAFVEANVLAVLTDWLAPMPDKSLPSVQIRKQLLKLLSGLTIDDHSRLKESGIGKAVMYLYKHPRELRVNKDLAGRIISTWARPIFNLSTDFKTITKEERMARDEMLAESNRGRSKPKEPEEPDQEGLRPGDPGYCMRARVPRAASSSYVNRPAWQSDVDISRVPKKEKTRLEKQMIAAAEKKRNSKTKRAIEISIEGRKMAL